MHNAVRPQREQPRFLRRWQCGADAAEIGIRNASAMTNAAVVARRAAVVHLRQDRGSPDGHDAVIKFLRQRVAHILLHAGHLHRRQKFSVRQLRQPFRLAADARERFHVVVPRRDVRVPNGPVNRDAILQVGFKIQIAPAVALPAPGYGFPAHLPAANPRKFLVGIGGIRIFLVADEKLVGIFVASVVTLALHRLRAGALRAIVPAPILQLPHRNMLDVIALRQNGAPRFQHQHPQPFFRELLRRPAPGNSRTDNDRIIGICRRHVPLAPCPTRPRARRPASRSHVARRE